MGGGEEKRLELSIEKNWVGCDAVRVAEGNKKGGDGKKNNWLWELDSRREEDEEGKWIQKHWPDVHTIKDDCMEMNDDSIY